MSTELVMLSDKLIFCHPHLLLPSVFPNISVFSNESAFQIRWPNDWSFSFSISPSSEYSGLVSFRIDWLDPFSIQGILKSLLQHHDLTVSILQGSSFFMVQLSHLYYWKNHRFDSMDLHWQSDVSTIQYCLSLS